MRLFISIFLIISIHLLGLFYGKSSNIQNSESKVEIKLNLIAINETKKLNTDMPDSGQKNSKVGKTTSNKVQPEIIQSNPEQIRNKYLEKLNTFIGENIIFPEKAKKLKITGTQLVNFTIQADGKISNVSIKESLHELLDRNTLNTIENLPKFEQFPSSIKKRELNVSIPISYQLN